MAVCRGTLQLPVPDELEGVTNGSLANIIRWLETISARLEPFFPVIGEWLIFITKFRQLSTLSRHAEEMFGNLFHEAEGIKLKLPKSQAERKHAFDI